MTTAKVRTYQTLILTVVLLGSINIGSVLAQSTNDATKNDATKNLPITASSSTSTAAASQAQTKSTDNKNWYRLETITGDIDVGDFVVGPGRTEVVLQPGESVTKEITVTNRITDNRQFKLEIEDIKGTADGSESVSLTGDERGPYSVHDYISIPEKTFTIDLGQRARIPITISVPPDAEPGGHYGSVLVSTVRSAQQTDKNTPRSPIIARVGSLFFIRVAGEVETQGSTKELSLINKKWWYEKGPIDFGVVYENTGSVHLNPYGEISITNMFGEQVGAVELGPWFVLPKSLRLREIAWDREFLLGRYTATAQINRGYDDIIDEVKVSFWVLPWKLVGGIFLVIFLIVFSFKAFFSRFEFKRK